MRYTGPKAKRCRAMGGVNLCGNEKFDRIKKAYPPGQHGQDRKKRSDYALHLMEKQKIRWTYGVSERQMVTLFEEAAKTKGVTGEVLLQLLERRLDNVLWRSGLFASRDQARQVVAHGHVIVNHKPLDVASARLKIGDVITFRQRSLKVVKAMSEGRSPILPEWITVQAETLTITLDQIPVRDQLDQTIQDHLVVEFYKR